VASARSYNVWAKQMKHITGVLFWGVFAFAGCVTENEVRLPANLLVPEPVRILGPTQLRAPSEMGMPAVPLDIIIDVSRVENEAPYIKLWAKHAATVCKTWFPVLCAELGSENFKPRGKITFVFLRHYFAPAQYYKGRIFISTDDLCGDLSNYGMMIHELTHAVQEYPGVTNVDWLVEGIADYTRFYLYETDPLQGCIRPGQSKYTDSYRTTACFLDYLVRNYDKAIVKKFNAALRKNSGVTENDIKRIIAEDADLEIQKRQTMEILFNSFIADWTKNFSTPTVKKASQ
jgi:hypothetical protein